MNWQRLRVWIWPTLILLAGVASGLAVYFERWLWLRAAATGIATCVIGAAAYYAREQARQARAQVDTARQALNSAQGEADDARDEAAVRSDEATRAIRIATATLRESIKSRIDAGAPRVSVTVKHQLAVRSENSNSYRLFDDVDDSLLASSAYLAERRLRLTLTFTITNHAGTPVSVFVPSNPFTIEAGTAGYTTLLPGEVSEIRYFTESNFINWQQRVRTGYGTLGHEQNIWMLSYSFQVADLTGEALDTHVWRGEVIPFNVTEDGAISRRSITVNGPPVASVTRDYLGLEG